MRKWRNRQLQHILFRLITLAVIGYFSPNVFAQSSTSVEIGLGEKTPIHLLRVSHADLDIDVDGRLDEKIWTRLEPFGEALVIEPDTLKIPPYATDTRMFYTERGLYVAFDLEQPADTIIERYVPRDAYNVSRDNIGFTLDTSGVGRYGYWMNLSLGDSEMDGTVLPERTYGMDWDGAWYGGTQRTERGWSAEFFVPWSQMAMPKHDGTRRIGLFYSRSVAHLNERWGYPGLPETQARFLSLFQPLELDGVDPRQQWSVFPYASATLDQVDDEVRYKAGVDLFWRPSTNFQFTAAVNPDFGSIESDNVVVNLTANETFFPEKRLFFLEGNDIFNLSQNNYGYGKQALSVVNTRRIGGRPRDIDLPDGVELSERQELLPADIITAAKATGQIGSFRYGVLTAFENTTNYIADNNQAYSQDGRDFGVFRLLYEDSIGAAYRGLGWITTLVQHPEAEAIVHGTDFHYLTTNGKWNVNGQALFSDRSETGTGAGGTVDLTYTKHQGLKHIIRTSILDDEINVNDLGFQTRNDISNFEYRVEWIKSGLKRIRNFRFAPFIRYGENGAGLPVNHSYVMSGLVTFHNLFRISGFLGLAGSRFEDRNSFGNGTYALGDRVMGDLRFASDESKPLSIAGKIGVRGEDVYGNSIESRIGLNWRPKHNLSIGIKVFHSDRNGWLLHQEDRNFTAFQGKQWQPELNLEFFPNSKQQIRLAMQWIGIRANEERFFTLPTDSTILVEGPKPPGDSDDFSISQLNFQIRYRWQIAPLSDLFVVYTKGDRHRTGLTSFGDLFNESWNNPLGDQLVVKLRYRLGS